VVHPTRFTTEEKNAFGHTNLAHHGSKVGAEFPVAKIKIDHLQWYSVDFQLNLKIFEPSYLGKFPFLLFAMLLLISGVGKKCSRPQLWGHGAPSWCVRMHFSLHSSEASSMNHTQLNFELIWSTTLFNSESQNLRLGKNLSLSCNSHNESNHIAQSLTRFESVSIKL
jgi:hypothetical protein